MRTDDFQINKLVHSVLVHHGIDTSKCSIKTLNGKVTIRGHIVQLFHRSELDKTGKKEEMNSKGFTDLITLATRVDQDLRRMEEIENIRYDFDNLTKEKGKWRLK